MSDFHKIMWNVKHFQFDRAIAHILLISIVNYINTVCKNSQNSTNFHLSSKDHCLNSFIFGLCAKYEWNMHGGSHLYYVHRVIFVLCFRVSSFKPNNVVYIAANKLKFTVAELDSVYLWHLWPLCLKWISVSVGIDLPCCFRTESCFVFFPWIEGNIRRSMLWTRLPTEVWECIFSFGIQVEVCWPQATGFKTQKLNQSGSRFGRIVSWEALPRHWLLLYTILQAVLLSRILCW